MSHFSAGFILQTKVSPNIFLVSGGPLFINLISKTGPEEEKVLIEKENVEYD